MVEIASRYPRIARAIALSREALLAEDYQRGRALINARQAERAAFEEELLPAIFPGEAWKLVFIQPSDLYRRHCESIPERYGCHLFDHARVFRRRRTSGPTTWKNTVVIGQPYGAFSNGAPSEATLRHARKFAVDGIDIWISAELSTHYPGWTTLIVAAPGLPGDRASDLGFSVISEMEEPHVSAGCGTPEPMSPAEVPVAQGQS